MESIELLGAERLIHARLGDERLTVRVEESVPVPGVGGALELSPRPDRLHHFDAATGLRVEA